MNPDYEPRKGSTIRKMMGALRIYEEQHPESQVLESAACRVTWPNLSSQRVFRTNPLVKQMFPVALTNALFLAAKEVDHDPYRYMGLLRASKCGGGEAANLHRSEIVVICESPVRNGW
jgi:hypothetical protein